MVTAAQSQHCHSSWPWPNCSLPMRIRRPGWRHYFLRTITSNGSGILFLSAPLHPRPITHREKVIRAWANLQAQVTVEYNWRPSWRYQSPHLPLDRARFLCRQVSANCRQMPIMISKTSTSDLCIRVYIEIDCGFWNHIHLVLWHLTCFASKKPTWFGFKNHNHN